MPPSIGQRIEHHGQTLIVGHGGQLYAPRTSIDAWGRTRHTQKVTKYRIVPCGCGHTFIAHDGRIKRCADCQARIRQERQERCAVETPPRSVTCSVCGQPLTAQRRTKLYCSRACQQSAYRKRRPKATEQTPTRGTTTILSFWGMCRIRVKSYHKASEQDHQYRSEPSWVSTSALMKPLRILAILEAS